MRYFFSSDLHVGHNNILKYCKRPFSSIDEMKTEFISRWNSVVTNEDRAYILGDVFVGGKTKDHLDYISQLKAAEIHLVLGNHDEGMPKVVRDKFASVSYYKEIEVPEPENSYNGKQLIVLSHYAFRVWNQSHHGSWNLYGHSHGATPGNTQQLDVGVDCWDYTPCSYEQIKERLKTLEPFFQHNTASERNSK